MFLKDKTIIVTGAASGIGAESAKEIMAQGGRVVAVDRNAPDFATAAFHKVDLTDEAALDALISELAELRADGLANIAGVPPTAPPETVVTVNWVAARRLATGLAGRLAEGAAIVNLASLAGLGWEQETSAIRAAESLTHADVPAFCANFKITAENSYFFSKQALIAWTHKNRWTWRDRGVRMNAISPGPVETPILGDFLRTLGARAEEDMRIMDRPGRPTDIAPVVAFLLSPASGWIRGANIPVDGGMRAHIQATEAGLL
jgi:NAD(P)-dependent dehydrogenase (short-subunit alcohol dehydrogenase family)